MTMMPLNFGRLVTIVSAMLFLLLQPYASECSSPPSPPMDEFLATQHIAACYYINGSVPSLWDGALQINRIGSRVFKFALGPLSKMQAW
jgi:hypothetical protein